MLDKLNGSDPKTDLVQSGLSVSLNVPGVTFLTANPINEIIISQVMCPRESEIHDEKARRNQQLEDAICQLEQLRASGTQPTKLFTALPSATSPDLTLTEEESLILRELLARHPEAMKRDPLCLKVERSKSTVSKWIRILRDKGLITKPDQSKKKGYCLTPAGVLAARRLPLKSES